MAAQVLAQLSAVERAYDLLIQDLDDEIVMANVETGTYDGLGDVAREIWLLLERARRVSDIRSESSERYAEDPAACEGEVLGFLGELVRERMIHIADGT